MSCDTEYLEKNSFWFFRKRGLRRFGLCAIVLMFFVQTVRKKMGVLTERKTPTFQNDVELLFSLVVTKIFFEVSLLGTIRVFCSNAESSFGCASFRRLGAVLWLVTSCVWDILCYRILMKTAFVSWAKQKLSKTTFSTFQKCLFELCSAGFFGC